MSVYYNEFDPKAAAWLRELMACGALPDGEVDERSITDVSPEDLDGFTQCHFFAGIGGWPLALSLAGWGCDRPVWTGSCPCQPFSAAGKQRGYEDERHLAPVFLRLIAECRPPVVFGEQVASKAGRHWLADLRAEMEALGYDFGAADLCAAGIGAPHIRQRLFFGAARVADTLPAGWPQGRAEPRSRPAPGCDEPRRLADTDDARPQGRRERGNGADQRALGAAGVGGGLADPNRSGRSVEPQRDREQVTEREACKSGSDVSGRGDARGLGDNSRTHETHGGWQDADWLLCRDAKWRPVEPGTFPLADGLPARVGRLRGYGNAIVPQLAATFISAFEETLRDVA